MDVCGLQSRGDSIELTSDAEEEGFLDVYSGHGGRFGQVRDRSCDSDELLNASSRPPSAREPRPQLLERP